MANKPASSIYSIVEKAYFRLQAGDVLTHCLEDGTTEPVHEMIQEMVLAGPQNLEALREILGEALKRKAQVYDDLNQVTNQLSIILIGYGISLERQGGNQVLQSLDEHQLLKMLDEQKIEDAEERAGALQILTNSQELISTLTGKIRLLENIEIYLQDWLWGLTYQSIKQKEDEPDNDIINNDVL
jgi:hypothetical protein